MRDAEAIFVRFIQNNDARLKSCSRRASVACAAAFNVWQAPAGSRGMMWAAREGQWRDPRDGWVGARARAHSPAAEASDGSVSDSDMPAHASPAAADAAHDAGGSARATPASHRDSSAQGHPRVHVVTLPPRKSTWVLPVDSACRVASVLARCVAPTLGPDGVDVAVINEVNQVLITNNGMAVLESLRVGNSMAQLAVDAARSFARLHGA